MHIAAPEPHSLALACGLSSLFVALVMASIRNPWVEARGALLFAGSGLATAMSFFLVAFAPPMEEGLLAALRGANTVLLFGLLVAGICRFVGQPAPWLQLGISMLLMTLLIQLYPESRPDVTPRVIGFSVLVSGWCLSGAWTLWRHPVAGLPRLGPVSAISGLLVLALASAARSAVLVQQGEVSGEQAFHAPLNSWLLLSGFAALLLTLTGLALMLNARMVLELTRLASHDPLTGAHNRKGFNAQWPAWQQCHGPGHVVLMDLDTTDGSCPSEQALLVLVNGLREALPPQALLARQSGGGFLAALPASLNAVQVQDWCAQLHQTLAQRLALQLSDLAGRGDPLTLSIGHAAVHHQLAEAARRANLAMSDGRRRRR